MALPQKLTLSQTQTTWANAINPVLANPLVNCGFLKNVSLVTGTNQVNTMLGRSLQGWFIVRQRASASVYDQQDSNQTPQLTLTLVASAPVVVDLVVY